MCCGGLVLLCMRACMYPCFDLFSIVRLVCDLLSRMGCAWLLVGKLGHTGLVPFVDELGTICGEVPLEYGFAVPI